MKRNCKRIIAFLVCISLLMCGCAKKVPNNDEPKVTNNKKTEVEQTVQFNSLNNPELCSYMESDIYNAVVDQLDSEEYFVENVEAVYISQEYIDELKYNSKENIYFGYTLSELEKEFEGKPYIFTLGEDGKTIVKEFEAYDDTYDQIIKNVAIGTGVILVCVTVSVVSAGAGAPAVSMIFATAAKTGTVMALSSGALGGTAAGVTKAIETGGDIEASIKAAGLAGSESFKVAAILGTVGGGASEAIALKGATINGLTMNEAAAIQKESKYPLDVIKGFQSKKQYEICKEAGLTTKMINNQNALIRDIDLNFVDPESGLTNLQRMKKGLSALEPATGKPYELHHVGQNMDSTLAILTQAEHRLGGNDAINHLFKGPSKIDRNVFNSKIKPQFWKNLAKVLEEGL